MNYAYTMIIANEKALSGKIFQISLLSNKLADASLTIGEFQYKNSSNEKYNHEVLKFQIFQSKNSLSPKIRYLLRSIICMKKIVS